MRNRRRTIESLRRLAERPGTKAEGETAQRILDQMKANAPKPKPLNLDLFTRGTEIYYNRWAYERNTHGVIVGRKPQTVEGQTWMRIKFDHLKQPRSVPVTSAKGCHLSTNPLPEQEADFLYHDYRD